MKICKSVLLIAGIILISFYIGYRSTHDIRKQDMLKLYERILKGEHIIIDNLLEVTGLPSYKENLDEPFENWLFPFPDNTDALAIRVNTEEGGVVGVAIVTSYRKTLEMWNLYKRLIDGEYIDIDNW